MHKGLSMISLSRTLLRIASLAVLLFIQPSSAQDDFVAKTVDMKTTKLDAEDSRALETCYKIAKPSESISCVKKLQAGFVDKRDVSWKRFVREIHGFYRMHIQGEPVTLFSGSKKNRIPGYRENGKRCSQMRTTYEGLQCLGRAFEHAYDDEKAAIPDSFGDEQREYDKKRMKSCYALSVIEAFQTKYSVADNLKKISCTNGYKPACIHIIYDEYLNLQEKIKKEKISLLKDCKDKNALACYEYSLLIPTNAVKLKNKFLKQACDLENFAFCPTKNKKKLPLTITHSEKFNQLNGYRSLAKPKLDNLKTECNVNNEPSACHYYANILSKGSKTKTMDSPVVKLYQKACNLNHYPACSELLKINLLTSDNIKVLKSLCEEKNYFRFEACTDYNKIKK